MKFLKENKNSDKLQLFSKNKAKIYDLEEWKKMQKQRSHNKIRWNFIEEWVDIPQIYLNNLQSEQKRHPKTIRNYCMKN